MAHPVVGQGIITFHEQCILRQHNIQIHSFKEYKSKIDQSYLPRVNLTELLSNTRRKPIPDLTIGAPTNHSIEISSIREQLHELKQIRKLDQTNHHNTHHYILIYLIIVSGICWIVSVHRNHQKSINKQRDVVMTQHNAQNMHMQTGHQKNI